SHTMGYSFQEATNPGVMHTEMANLELVMQQMAEQFPHVARLAPLLVQCEFHNEYMFGLEIIIDGLEARLTR
ncbi:MAG: TetR/AcrR family transcriptional regulator C-terminal domain-containing protein, partial [Acidimicrobiia bacterium]